MKVLGLIPARGGSKGVPGKNTRELLGKSLIERAYSTACAAGVLDRIVLSSDDETAVRIAGKIGLEVPFVRPAEVSGDTTAMIDVVLHALDCLEKDGYLPDAVCLLQPTSPLRQAKHIQQAVEILGEHDSVCTVIPLPQDLCPHYVMKITEDGYLDHFMPDGAKYTRRQDVPLAYRREGTIFLTKTSVLREQRSFYGSRCKPLPLDLEESLNIDTAEEWAEAETRLTELGG